MCWTKSKIWCQNIHTFLRNCDFRVGAFYFDAPCTVKINALPSTATIYDQCLKWTPNNSNVWLWHYINLFWLTDWLIESTAPAVNERFVVTAIKFAYKIIHILSKLVRITGRTKLLHLAAVKKLLYVIACGKVNTVSRRNKPQRQAHHQTQWRCRTSQRVQGPSVIHERDQHVLLHKTCVHRNKS